MTEHEMTDCPPPPEDGLDEDAQDYAAEEIGPEGDYLEQLTGPGLDAVEEVED